MSKWLNRAVQLCIYIAAVAVVAAGCVTCDALCREDARYTKRLADEGRDRCVLPYYWDGRAEKCRDPRRTVLW